MEYFDVDGGRIVRRTFSQKQVRVVNTETTKEWIVRSLTDERMVALHDRIRRMARALDMPLVSTLETVD